MAAAKPSALSVVLALLLALCGCARSEDASGANPNCTDAHLNSVANQGYSLISSGDLYRAHLVGHELVTLGYACGQSDVGASATIQGNYMLAFVFYSRGVRSQAILYTQNGLAALDALKNSGLSSTQNTELYNQMEPRFLALQERLR